MKGRDLRKRILIIENIMTNKKDIDFNKDYWDKFYSTSHKHVPSQFCVFVATDVPKNTVFVELGSGNGRDALYIASRGHITVATDLSEQAIRSCDRAAEDRDLDHATFVQGDLTQQGSLENVVELARKHADQALVVFYSRFIMHSLDDEQELEFLRHLGCCMKKGEKIYFEFRSKEDADLEKIHRGHFRRYVDTGIFKQRLLDQQFEIDYCITGMGMAKYKTEDPIVSRIIAKKL